MFVSIIDLYCYFRCSLSTMLYAMCYIDLRGATQRTMSTYLQNMSAQFLDGAFQGVDGWRGGTPFVSETWKIILQQ